MGGVETAGDADHHPLDVRRAQPGLEALHLDRVDLLATLGAAGGIRGHIREALDLAGERGGRSVRDPELELDPLEPRQRPPVVVDAVAEAAGGGAVGHKPVEVDVGDEELLVLGEAL